MSTTSSTGDHSCRRRTDAPIDRTLRGDCYGYTSPCVSTGEYPHDRDPDDCDAMACTVAFDCPSSVSPHALRRGGITPHPNSDVTKEAVSDRANGWQTLSTNTTTNEVSGSGWNCGRNISATSE